MNLEVCDLVDLCFWLLCIMLLQPGKALMVRSVTRANIGESGSSLRIYHLDGTMVEL